MPPANDGKENWNSISLGTDAHRVSTYNPFTVLQWALDGKTASGAPVRGPEETPSRADALRFYTMGSAWVSFDEGRARIARDREARGASAVLSADYMTEPVEQIGKNVSLLTMVGGRGLCRRALRSSRRETPKAVGERAPLQRQPTLGRFRFPRAAIACWAIACGIVRMYILVQNVSEARDWAPFCSMSLGFLRGVIA